MDSAYVGQVIDGRYDVLGVLGEGGMGVVLHARHKFTGHEVALKVLRSEIALNHDARARFLAEARAPAAIGHPAIVSITDAGASAEGLYFAMELLKGEPLASAIARGAASLPWVRHVAGQLLDALAAAHSAGFIHRDLKPANVFLVGDPAAPTVKLLDFGIAKVMSQAVEAKGQTAMGTIMGTLAYMSPEQLADSSHVDARTDLWAVGVMIFEMLTGALPYEAHSFAEMFLAIRTGPPRSMRSLRGDVTAPLDGFMARALSVDVAGRFGSAGEMRAALLALPDSMPSTLVGPPVGPATPSDRASFSSATGPPVPQTSQAFSVAVSTNAHVSAPGVAATRTATPGWIVPAAVAGALVALVAASVALYYALEKKPSASATSRGEEPETRRTPAHEPTSGPKSEPRANACEDGCKLLAGTCGARVDATCVARCEADPIVRSCAGEALTRPDRCAELAVCAWEATCNARIDAGVTSCREAMTCQASRPGDAVSGCACLSGISPSGALYLWRNDSCASLACAAECTTGSTPMRCGACVAQRCRRENQDCGSH